MPEDARYATPSRRLIAAVIDGAVLAVPVQVLSWMLGGRSIASVVALTYFIAMTAVFGRTIGKLLTGIRVVRSDGRPLDWPAAVLREVLGKFLSGLVFGLGYLWALWDERSQGWHDKLAGTVVVRGRAVPPDEPPALGAPVQTWVPEAVRETIAAQVNRAAEKLTSNARPATRPTRVTEPEDATLTILFADVEDAAELTERLGDDASRDALRGFESAVRECAGRHEGRFVKSSGDRVLLTFRSSRRAVHCALAIRDAADRKRLRVAIGLHAGEVVHDAGDVHGRNVVMASRITSVAESGTVLVSSLVKELAGAAGEFTFSDGRQTSLKELSGTFTVYEVTA